ncbi:MAG: intermembrane transport protein PqiB [Hoeflea sp.]|uniref:PqiB family protein n=1 Tax=Hoeflea sp. TaxID=1940281 RepID=UPI003EF93896
MSNVAPDLQNLPSPQRETTRRRPSLIWLMPLLAVAVSAGVVWNNYASKGPLITIAFKSASGISAGSTEVRIRDLRVGIVEAVGFSDGMEAVEAQVRIDKNVARYVDTEAEFWLVEPKITARGVSGIGTLLSGVYIAANWDGEGGILADRFVALEVPPLASFGEEGTRIVLRSRAGGQLAAGAPVLTSGIEVGRIGQPTLSSSGTIVTMEAFILKPYNERLTTNVRFWDASGLSFNLGAQGLALKVNSLAALLEGGVTFGTPVTGGAPVEEGQVFDVFESESLARANAFEADTSTDITASILLDGDVNGLGLDTIVRFRGVKVGEVEDLVGVPSEDGTNGPIRLRVDLRLSPKRLGLPKDLSAEKMRMRLDARVANGLRARVGSEGLLGQTVILELVSLPSQPEAEIILSPDGRMMLPTAPAAIADADSGVNGLATRISKLPIEELMTAATKALSNISKLTDTAEGVLAADGMDRIPGTIDQTLQEVRSLVTAIREGGAIDNLNTTLRSADSALKSIDTAASTLPALAKRLNEAADGLQAVVSGYDSDSRFYNDIRGVLRDISTTAESFRSLARSIERNPNSLLLGR